MCTEATLVQGGERFGPYGMSGHGYIPRIDRIVKPGEEVVVEAIFDPYERAHSEPTQPGSVGLGLAVARQLTRMMGGDLTYSRVGDTTRFEMTVPRYVEVPQPVRI